MTGLEIAIPSVISLLGALFGGGSSGTSLSPEMRTLMTNALRNQNNRMLLQNPLYEEATQLARSLLPRSARPQTYYLGGIDQSMPGELGGRTPPADAVYTGKAKRRGTTTSSATAEAMTRLGASLPAPTLR